jgi:hypothetical protein
MPRSTTPPDLTASASVGSSYTSGQTGVQIPVTVSRTGGSLTGSTYVHAKLYWSANSTWDTGDSVLWSSNDSNPDFPNSTLNSIGSATVTATINIPSTSGGTYYIIAYADAPTGSYPSGFYNESNENNNTASYAVTVSDGPDTTPPTVNITSPCSSSCTVTTSPITVSGSATDSGGSGLDYVFVSNNNGSSGFDYSVSGDSDTFSVSGISLEEGPNTISAMAVDSAGNPSPWYYIYVTYNPPTPTAGTPSSIFVPSSDSDGNYTVSWGTSSTSGVTYVLEEATNSGFTSGKRTAYSGSSTSRNITGRSNGVTYYYRVKATKNGYNNSAWNPGSNGCTVTFPTPTTGTPSSIAVPSSDSDGIYTVSWGTSSTSGVMYVLEEATNPSFTSGLRTAYSGSSTNKNITGRSNGVTYYYRVKATKNGYNNSAWNPGSNGCTIYQPTIVWVDFTYTGTESGTQAEPYNTLAEAINAVAVGGEIIIKGGITPETFTGINKKVTIKSSGGTATIGKQ